jgi:hypothetical protein
LNVKNLEHYHETLVAQYRDMIHEAILESEHDHKTSMDIGALNTKLKTIMNAAKVDGLPESTVNQLIDEAIPAPASKAA